MGVAADAARVAAEKPDRLVIAVGADPARPDIPGIEEAGAVWAGDVCAGDAETGERVVVAGGGGIGCETALHLARQGKKVTVVEMLPEAACDFNFINRGMLLELHGRGGRGSADRPEGGGDPCGRGERGRRRAAPAATSPLTPWCWLWA